MQHSASPTCYFTVLAGVFQTPDVNFTYFQFAPTYYSVGMSKSPDDKAVQTAHEWLVEAAEALNLPPDHATRHIRALLDLTRDVAHNRSRPAAPLTAFLVGLASNSPEEVEGNIDKLSALVNADRTQEKES